MYAFSILAMSDLMIQYKIILENNEENWISEPRTEHSRH